jgi:hypothetical protein
VSGEGGAAQQRPAAERGSWARLYALVIAALTVDILLLWWLTERYK